MKTSALAQIEVESPELKSLIFLPENSDQRKLVLWLRKIRFLGEDLKRKAGLAPEKKHTFYSKIKLGKIIHHIASILHVLKSVIVATL
ncbi:hypothetical protein [Flavobacterium anhuiense]|uniref:hypothetical protein n=1 Tax=Flavobacterium anhuiense TaxID=459526 RepID=UPI003D990AB6